MDARPDGNQDDYTHGELEITDIDAEETSEAGNHPVRPSKLKPLFAALARRARLWFTLAIIAACVVIAVLLFPEVSSLITSVASTPTAPAGQPLYTAMTGSDNVTFVLERPQNDDQVSSLTQKNTNVTAYDTRTGTLLWRTSQSPTSSMSYGVTVNLYGEAFNIYAIHADGQISLLAPRSGKVLWTYKLPSLPTKSTAVEQDGMLLLSDADQTTYAVKDGRLLWHSADIDTTLAINDGIIYACGYRQQYYYAIDERSGTRLWAYNNEASSTQPFASNPVLPFAVKQKTFYLQTDNNKVLAIQPQGHVVWSHQFNDTVDLNADAHYLYAYTQGVDTLEVFDLQTGKKEHTPLPETGIADFINIQNNVVYIQTESNELQSINVDTGIMWKKALDANQAVWTIQGGLYISSLHSSSAEMGLIQAINKRDGTVLWSQVIQSHLTSINGGLLDLLSQDNQTISVLQLNDGKILWSKHIE
ncbi:PQQ-binding-like beta-propeller repeat protein [Dictyobacter aurantiacus]|uniref:Pyrrolo-quinoline quinone repeat domain-containing protein n=1 Tax=Dictyobacter aurantiacus TaxID=1936993 RepID=A0A401ZRV7_9CHLR|nr:PQQ-binding-like beta-propeller repeat protein [Dictyobacter aurantiacus]GCE09583.1 hypothetical protein KDAU_69120 [Dictyobacter aurantiacus]